MNRGTDAYKTFTDIQIPQEAKTRDVEDFPFVSDSMKSCQKLWFLVPLKARAYSDLLLYCMSAATASPNKVFLSCWCIHALLSAHVNYIRMGHHLHLHELGTLACRIRTLKCESSSGGAIVTMSVAWSLD